MKIPCATTGEWVIIIIIIVLMRCVCQIEARKAGQSVTYYEDDVDNDEYTAKSASPSKTRFGAARLSRLFGVGKSAASKSGPPPKHWKEKPLSAAAVSILLVSWTAVCFRETVKFRSESFDSRGTT